MNTAYVAINGDAKAILYCIVLYCVLLYILCPLCAPVVIYFVRKNILFLNNCIASHVRLCHML